MRNSELKYSAYKSTADKTWVDPRELSPRNHAKMVINFEDSIFDNKCLEDKRTNLALRYDFCLTELFAMIDYAKTGLLSLSDWQRFVRENSLTLNSDDLVILIERFDKSRDGLLTFSEFSDIWLPTANDYRRMMQERKEKYVTRFLEYSVQTQAHIEDLLRSIITVEENFETNKFRLTDGRYLSSDEIFGFLDQWKTGYITFIEFENALSEVGVKCSSKDARI